MSASPFDTLMSMLRAAFTASHNWYSQLHDNDLRRLDRFRTLREYQAEVGEQLEMRLVGLDRFHFRAPECIAFTDPGWEMVWFDNTNDEVHYFDGSADDCAENYPYGYGHLGEATPPEDTETQTFKGSIIPINFAPEFTNKSVRRRGGAGLELLDPPNESNSLTYDYDTEVMADSPRAYWKMEDGPDYDSQLDSSGNNFHGTFVSPTYGKYIDGLTVGGPIVETTNQSLKRVDAGDGSYYATGAHYKDGTSSDNAGFEEADIYHTGDMTLEIWLNLEERVVNNSASMLLHGYGNHYYSGSNSERSIMWLRYVHPEGQEYGEFHWTARQAHWTNNWPDQQNNDPILGYPASAIWSLPYDPAVLDNGRTHHIVLVHNDTLNEAELWIDSRSMGKRYYDPATINNFWYNEFTHDWTPVTAGNGWYRDATSDVSSGEVQGTCSRAAVYRSALSYTRIRTHYLAGIGYTGPKI